jgi:predicted kinase
LSTMIICRGVPASGKSTWAKAWLAEKPLERVRVNRDNLRWTLGIKEGVGTQEQEREVTYWQNAMIERALEQGKDVVVDNTNLRAKFVKDLMRQAYKHGAYVEFKDFPISLADAKERDHLRALANERNVGPQVIEMFFEKFVGKDGKLPPEPVVQFDEPVKFRPYKEQVGLPHCVIVDIDGTLAHMEDKRGPYDTHLYHVDRFDDLIASIVYSYTEWGANADIILLSGRSEDFRNETEAWLEYYDMKYENLYMRPTGDSRNDAIVKDELFEKHIAGKYNVDFILDDRNRVVEMWRAKGLKVLQVADGDF